MVTAFKHNARSISNCKRLRIYESRTEMKFYLKMHDQATLIRACSGPVRLQAVLRLK